MYHTFLWYARLVSYYFIATLLTPLYIRVIGGKFGDDFIYIETVQRIGGGLGDVLPFQAAPTA